jgi:hypothetical protein
MLMYLNPVVMVAEVYEPLFDVDVDILLIG